MTKQLERDGSRLEDGWPSIVVLISVASALSGGIAYLATSPAQPLAVAGNAAVPPATSKPTVAPAAAPTALPAADDDNPPLRFKNPFDANEVFEFPSGTSLAEARQAVADVLLQRAHEREKSWSKITYQRRRAADQLSPVRTSSIAQRG